VNIAGEVKAAELDLEGGSLEQSLLMQQAQSRQPLLHIGPKLPRAQRILLRHGADRGVGLVGEYPEITACQRGITLHAQRLEPHTREIVFRREAGSRMREAQRPANSGVGPVGADEVAPPQGLPLHDRGASCQVQLTHRAAGTDLGPRGSSPTGLVAAELETGERHHTRQLGFQLDRQAGAERDPSHTGEPGVRGQPQRSE
jgi:hypothetical protein